MESSDVLKKAIDNLGVKSVASDMGLSRSLIYKWCQAKDAPEAGGVDNPLDRVAKLLELTGESGPVEWLCQKADGFYVKNPPADQPPNPFPLKATQEILSEFSDLLEVVSRSIEDDQAIDEREAKRIRKVWEQLKSITEGFVVACESGTYGKKE
jgi:hypothetical protein